MNKSEQSLMTQHEAAVYMNTSIGVLNTWRSTGKQKIPFIRWGRSIRYRKSDLDVWLLAHSENIINQSDKGE